MTDRHDRPFLILTLQRTGGTNFTFQLTHRSSFKLAETHEPFNRPRVYGHVTKAWEQDKDRAALETAMDEIAARLDNIKHCVEMVPGKITEALTEAALGAGYSYLFLYREDPVARILSTEYASRTKIWGPRHVHKVSEDAAAFETPLDVDKLLKRETRCITQLNKAWGQLRAAGAAPVALAYEELYGPDLDRAWAGLSRVLNGLQLGQGEDKDRALLASLRSKGDQNTRDRYRQFARLDELRAGAGSLPGFDFAQT